MNIPLKSAGLAAHRAFIEQARAAALAKEKEANSGDWLWRWERIRIVGLHFDGALECLEQWESAPTKQNWLDYKSQLRYALI